MPTVSVADTKLWYEVAGRGDPTVFVHGSLVDHTTWERVRRGLAPSLQTLVYDRRGYGTSSGPHRVHPVRDDAGDLSRLLDAIDLYPVHVIAHSYGVAVGLRLAADRPEMVRSLVLHEPLFVGLLEDDPATAPEADRLRQGMREMQSLVRSSRQEEAARMVVDALSSEERGWDRTSPEVQRAILRYVDRWSEEIMDPEATKPESAALNDLLIPVLVTTGERSPPFLHRVAAQLAGRLRNATSRSLPGVGHVPHLSDPDQFIALVHGFLVERAVPFT